MTELIGLFWLADIMNLPFMARFDGEYPLNGVFWFCGWLLIAFINESKRNGGS